MTRTLTTIIVSGALLIVGLLSGGVAVALWNDDDPLATTVISTGDLDLTLQANPTWSDLSDDVTGTPKAIGADFLTVPGDTLAFEQSFDVATTGDNMRAAITVDVPLVTDIVGTLSNDIDVTYSLLDDAGGVVGSIDGRAAGTPSVFDITGADDSAESFTVRVVFTWQSGALDRTVTNSAHLDAVTIELRQVRL